jgi:ankyrin repeat protein
MGLFASKNSAAGKELVVAAMQKDLNAVERMLADGCPPDAPDAEGNTALGAACFSGSKEIVRSLLAANADLEHKNAIGTCTHARHMHASLCNMPL